MIADDDALIEPGPIEGQDKADEKRLGATEFRPRHRL
jgi:hypothetical protein